MVRIDTDLMSVLPEYYSDIADYQEIMTAESAELVQLATFINAVHDNFFLETMDANTASAWEQLLGIASSAGASLEFRRQRILNRISTRPPFTLDFLYHKLDELIGEGKWEVTMDYANYTLYVESSAESQDYAIEVAYTINQMKPAHIVYINRPFVAETLLLGETISASGISYNYALGSWRLGVAPFENVYDERIYKMATAQSVTSELISDVTGYVSSDVASARVNGTIAISTLTKSSSNGILTVSYSFLQSQASVITKLELLDSNSNVLTTSNVYIPVTGDLQITHKIQTKEG